MIVSCERPDSCFQTAQKIYSAVEGMLKHYLFVLCIRRWKVQRKGIQ